jgi:hypothetical protein
MTFTMSILGKSKSGAYTARKVIPEDVREEYQRLFGKRSKTGKLGNGYEVRFYAKPGTPHGVAKAQFSDWLAEVETRISTIRASRNGDGQPLTLRQAHALAGDWYRWYVGQREENPGKASRWAALEDVLIDQILSLAPDWYREDSLRDPECEWAREPGALVELHPVVADEAKTTQFLASKGLVLSREARELFLGAVVDELPAAFQLLQRRARGDYSADERLGHFPKFEADKRRGNGGKTSWELFEGWVASAQPQPSTINRWRGVFEDLDEHFDGRAADSPKR